MIPRAERGRKRTCIFVRAQEGRECEGSDDFKGIRRGQRRGILLRDACKESEFEMIVRTILVNDDRSGESHRAQNEYFSRFGSGDGQCVTGTARVNDVPCRCRAKADVMNAEHFYKNEGRAATDNEAPLYIGSWC